MKEVIFSDQNLREYMLAIAYNMTGNIDNAKDIVQDAYVRFFNVKGEIHNPKFYLKRIVVNTSIDHLNKLKKRSEEAYVGFNLATPIEDDFWEDKETKKKTIDMATSLLFNKLTPYERAIFVLRNVYELKYSEIAEIVNESEVYCRKIYSRLKPQLATMTEEKEQSIASRKDVVEQFLQNIKDNNLEGLKSLFKADIKYYVDSGGKVKGAAINTIKGDQEVASFILSRLKKITPANSKFRLAYLNGSLNILSIHKNIIRLSVHLQIADNKIDRIYVIANPDKLRHLSI